MGLFYYAGHGLQVDQRNFLAPVDAQLNFEFIGAWVILLFLFTAMSFAGTIVTAPSLWVGMGRLDFEAVELDLVLKQMVRTPPPASSSSTLAAATNRVIAVEPAASGAAAPANASANGPAPPTAAAPPPADTKIAAAESKGAEAKEPEAVKATEPPLPGSVAREEV
ncbi:MAG: hypothetical protein ABSA62_16455, partial [Methyloceanibacter sp.]